MTEMDGTPEVFSTDGAPGGAPFQSGSGHICWAGAGLVRDLGGQFCDLDLAGEA